MLLRRWCWVIPPRPKPFSVRGSKGVHSCYQLTIGPSGREANKYKYLSCSRLFEPIPFSGQGSLGSALVCRSRCFISHSVRGASTNWPRTQSGPFVVSAVAVLRTSGHVPHLLAPAAVSKQKKKKEHSSNALRAPVSNKNLCQYAPRPLSGKKASGMLLELPSLSRTLSFSQKRTSALSLLAQ